jgi:hypothetical protein
MEANPVCLLLNKVHLFSLIQNRFILIQIVPLHVCYIFRPVRRPSPGMSIQKPYKERYNKIQGIPLFTLTIFIMLKHRM